MDEISPKKVTETKKIVETKKSPWPSTKKIPEKGNVEAPAKINPTILKRSTQTEVSSTNRQVLLLRRLWWTNQNC